MIAPSSHDSAVHRQAVRQELQQHYAALLHSLGWQSNGTNPCPRLIGITSCRRGEGVSTVAAHLATTAATLGKEPVLLLDANLSRPAVPRVFRVQGRPGWIEVLQSGQPWREVLQPSVVPRLALLVAGRLADQSPSSVYADRSLPLLLEELSSHFSLTFVDLPAVERSSDTLRLSAMCEGLLLVVEVQRGIPAELAKRVTRLLHQTGATPCGVVLNKYSGQSAS